jgi:hypothetical protein
VQDLYGTGEGADASFSYTVPPNHFTGTTTFTATPTIGPNISSVGPRPTIPLQTSHSTITPHIPTIPAGNAVVNQAPVGTPITPRHTLPFGFRALNNSATTTAQTTTQTIPGSSIPIQQPGGTGLGGPNPIGNIGQSLASSLQIPRTPPQTGGHPPSRGQIPFGGNPNAGGHPPTGGQIHSGGTLILGGNLNPEYTINHKDKMCPPCLIRGASLFKEIRMPPQDKMCPLHLIRGASLFKETHMPPQDKTFRLCNNSLMDKFQTHPTIHKTHPVILRSQILLKISQILCTLVKTNLI